jgi:lipoyl(octanoyl) transferase
MHLRHLPLPAPTTYQRATRLNDLLFARLLASKAHRADSPPPAPTILTFTPPPTYTFGRRRRRATGEPSAPDADAEARRLRALGAAVHAAPRGGQTTFHGPGQLVAYPVLDLARHGLRASAYVRLLEEALVAACAEVGVAARRREGEVGVWVSSSPPGGEGDGLREMRKIGAVGVRLRRFVAGHGVALNVGREPLRWFDEIVACGLEDVKSSSLVVEGAAEGTTVEEVGAAFVRELASRLKGVGGIEVASEGEVAAELSKADQLHDQGHHEGMPGHTRE